MDKKSLRTQALAVRERIRPEDAKAASMAVAKQLVKIIQPSAGIVAGYRAVRGEIDVFEAMAQLSERGHELCLPVIQGAGVRDQGSGRKELMFRRWTLGDTLDIGKYGIEIPPANEPKMTPDVVIVPLVAFDASLHRLGYGAGFYDATIHRLRESKKQVQIIGVAFATQQAEHIPAEAHDAKLDAVVTEKGIIGLLDD